MLISLDTYVRMIDMRDESTPVISNPHQPAIWQRLLAWLLAALMLYVVLASIGWSNAIPQIMLVAALVGLADLVTSRRKGARS